MNANQINTAISEGTWTNEELEGMIYCIKYARSRLGNQVKYKLR